MEKRALVAILLSVAVMALWQVLVMPIVSPPPATPPAGAPAVGDPAREATRPDSGAPAGPETRAAEPHPIPAAPVRAATKQEFRVTTATQDIRFSNEGGRAVQWRLTRYTVSGDIPVDLIPETARVAGVLPLQIEIPDEPETTRELATALYVHRVEDVPEGGAAGRGPVTRVTFRYHDGKGLSVRKVLELSREGYEARLSFDVRRDGEPLPAVLVWASGLAQPSDDGTVGYGHVEGQAVLHTGQKVLRLAPADVAQPMLFGAAGGAPVLWAGLESTYFASVLLLPEDGSALSIAIQPRQAPTAEGSKEEAAPLLTAGVRAPGGGSYRLFVGPKDYMLLRSMGHHLERAVDFSRFSLIYYCTWALFRALTWINSHVGNYGWSIIILTFIVRLAFFPLTYRSAITMRHTSRKMAKVQPRVKAIQERYRKIKKTMETQRKMNEEIMALYKKEGVNPMGSLGGCLPLLLQMPIFIGFYNLLAVTIEMRQAPFIFWLQDLSRRDPTYITPLLMGGSWLVQQWMTSSSIPDPTQRRMMMFMPVMFTLFMLNMPSGLVVYWLTSNILGMVQQYVTNRRADQLEAAARGRGESISKAG